jgi:hypothetical protein
MGKCTAAGGALTAAASPLVCHFMGRGEFLLWIGPGRWAKNPFPAGKIGTSATPMPAATVERNLAPRSDLRIIANRGEFFIYDASSNILEGETTNHLNDSLEVEFRKVRRSRSPRIFRSKAQR